MSEMLTAQQKTAVENRGGKLLVSAAAGSGKTKVLVDRLMSYLTDPVSPANLDDFLIITYTKAAASELRGKISDKLTKYISEHPENRHIQHQIQRLYMAKISTVHAFCADILREYAYRLDISADFRIAEENECHEMMTQVLNQVLDNAYEQQLEDECFRTFVDTQGLGRNDRQVPEIILQIYSSALCHLNPDGWLDWCVKISQVSNIQDAGETIWGSYLISDLKENLQMQIDSLSKCIETAAEVPGMEKPVILLKTTVADLRSLYACSTWDAISNHPPITYGTLTFKKDLKGTQLAEQIKAVRNYCKETLTKKLRCFTDSSQTILRQLDQAALATTGLVTLVREFRQQYDKIKSVRRVMDFSDIEQKTLDLLRGKSRDIITAAAREIGSRFREIMVDEFQDSNAVQDAIFEALTCQRQNCFMVGDVKQSIYQFRLADPGIFLSKYSAYAHAEDAQPLQGRKVLLTRNFRSSGGVIIAVNDVFQTCMSARVGGLEYTAEEQLVEGIPHVSLPDSEVELYGVDVQADTYEEEAKFVAQKISTMLEQGTVVRQGDTLRPITPDDIVILLRSPNSVGGEFRYALEQQGIPCTSGTDADLLQAPEVETLLSILQIIHNPLQDIPLIAALASPVFCFTADELAQVRSANRRISFYMALQESNLSKAESFLGILTQLRNQARFLSVTELIHQVFLTTHILSIYGAMENGESYAENLHKFCQVAADYEKTGRRDLGYFLDYMETMKDKGLSAGTAERTGAVRIMSIHKSKGLEFPVVFLCGLSRGFNTADIQKQVLCHKDLGLGLACVNSAQRVRFPTVAKRAIAAKIASDTVSEELRVLYVAMTRAKDRLIMTYAAQKLSDRLLDITTRLDMSCKVLMTAHVSCPGSWVLQAALQRTEAGDFFAISSHPDCTHVTNNPWTIRVVKPTDCVAAVAEDDVREDVRLSAELLEKMRSGLRFRYTHQAAVAVPSKLAATQVKGRFKDQESIEFTENRPTQQHRFRAPAEQRLRSSTDYGSAMHSFLQYVQYNKCSCSDNLRDEAERLVQANLITAEQAALLDMNAIVGFFSTDIGKQILQSDHVLREFKFTVLEDANNYYPDVAGESILLQGVVDCAIVDEDGITILDFKTDSVTDTTVRNKTKQYAPQVTTYAKALEKIFERPVKAAFLYFFKLAKFERII